MRSEQRGEVLVLFGGKGSGKSTFIKRLLHHKPPVWLGKHSVIAIVDLLTTPENALERRDQDGACLFWKIDLYEEPDVKDQNGEPIVNRVLTIMLAEEY